VTSLLGAARLLGATRLLGAAALALAGLGAACGGDGDPSAGPFGIDEPGVPGAPPAAPEPGTPVSGDGYEGVLLDAGLDSLLPADGPRVEQVRSFVPTEDDVARFEDALAGALATASNPSGEGTPTAAEMAGYVRQYTGVASLVGDDRHLVVAGICESAATNGLHHWQSGWIEVADGGTCFWDATMDLGTGEILTLGFHGSA
jgi:hypothetical protein